MSAAPDRGPRPRQALRRRDGGRQRRPHGRHGRRLRIPRPERGREDDVAADAARADPARRGHRQAVRARPPHRGGARPGRRGGLRRGAALLPVPDRPPQPRAGGGARRRRRRLAHRRGARHRRAGRARQGPRGRLLARHAPAARHRRRAAARPEAAAARRADHRPGPGRHARHARAGAAARRPGHHRAALLAPHGRGRGPVRPRRDRPHRPRRLRGLAARAARVDRRSVHVAHHRRRARRGAGRRPARRHRRPLRRGRAHALGLRGGGDRALARPRRGRDRHRRAGPAHGHARGAVLPHDRGRAGANCPPSARRRCDDRARPRSAACPHPPPRRRHRLPLGAAQARGPEADLPRLHRGDRDPGHLRRRAGGRLRAAARTRSRSAPTCARPGWPSRWCAWPSARSG